MSFDYKKVSATAGIFCLGGVILLLVNGVDEETIGKFFKKSENQLDPTLQNTEVLTQPEVQPTPESQPTFQNTEVQPTPEVPTSNVVPQEYIPQNVPQDATSNVDVPQGDQKNIIGGTRKNHTVLNKTRRCCKYCNREQD